MVLERIASDRTAGGRWRATEWAYRSLLIVPVLTTLLVSCGSLSLWKSDNAAKAQGVAKVEEPAPRPGDTKVIDGVEFEYVRNVLFSTQPYEPEYIWAKKLRQGK